jgi:hypothetical protein
MRRLLRGAPLGALLAEAPPSPVEPHYCSTYRGHPGRCQLAEDYEQDDGCEDGEEGNQVRPWGRPGRRWYFTHGSSFREESDRTPPLQLFPEQGRRSHAYCKAKTRSEKSTHNFLYARAVNSIAKK